MGKFLEEFRKQRDTEQMHRRAMKNLNTMSTVEYYTTILASKDKVEELSSKKFDLEQQLDEMKETPKVGKIDPQEIQNFSSNCEAIGTLAGMASVAFMGLPGFDMEAMAALGIMGGTMVAPALKIADQKHNFVDRTIDGIARHMLKKKIAKTNRQLQRAEIYNYELRNALSCECDIEDPRDIDCIEFEREWEQGL
jgi:hypothetical protein